MIRMIKPADREAVLGMMRVFYASPAVLSDESEEIFQADFDACVSENPYLEGYIFEDAGCIQGYGMVARSFSTEFGKPCVWIEDLYVLEKFRGMGLGSDFLRFIREKYSDSLLRLEVEADNRRAIHVYKKSGFEILPYLELKR